jgi:hypothetical protein
VERVEALAVAGQGTVAERGDALPGGVGVDLQQHDGVLAERLAHPLGAERAPTQRHGTPVGTAQRLQHDLLLPRPEGGFSLTLEEGGDSLPQLALEQLVGIESVGVGGPSGRRLARPHEADEDEGGAHHYLRQSIRSL